jgi:pyruvate,water dikinase
MPLISYPLSVTLFKLLPGFFRTDRARQKERKKVAPVVAENPQWCRQMQNRIGQIHAGSELVPVWRNEIEPRYRQVCRLVTASNTVDSPPRLQQDLSKLVGAADADALVSNLSGRAGRPESLGPLVGLANVARGAMSREAYLDRYGHRGPHEAEVSTPRPAEDPPWLDRQLSEFARSPVDVERLLAKQQAEFDAAWKRLAERYPRQARSMHKRIAQIAENTRAREAIRSEWVRVVGVARAFVLRAGELSGLGDSIFFLSIPEILTVLSGDESPARFIPARRETYARYCALPPYPTLINGRFDPFKWAADPNRRSDLFDSHGPAAVPAPDTITGFAGAAGTVEGLARRLDRAEDGDQLQPGEILVTTTTNVGWTLLFPRAAAIVTDVGAPLSHAAIVARELGIPAVVGCGNATMRIRTGDRLSVDGGQGTVKIL